MIFSNKFLIWFLIIEIIFSYDKLFFRGAILSFITLTILICKKNLLSAIFFWSQSLNKFLQNGYKQMASLSQF